MKKLINRYRLILLVSLVAVCTVTSSFAAGNKKALAAGAAVQTAIRYGGINEKGLVFYVQVSNPLLSRCQFRIENEFGDVVFYKSFKQDQLNEKIILANEGSTRVHFIVRAPGKMTKQSFDIKTDSKIIQNVSVKEQ